MESLCFITKNYPPAIGGMENYCRDLVKYFGKTGIQVNLVANGRGKVGLFLFAIKAFIYGILYSFKSDAIWIGDGSISFFGWILSKLTGKKWYVTIHALDITRNNKLYQKIIPWFVKQADHIVAVSTYTKEECIKRGIPSKKITVIPNGIDPDNMPNIIISKSSLFKRYNIPTNKKALFSIGRHIERKGVHLFLDHIMSKLGNDHIYIIAGSGSWTSQYKEVIARKGINNVYLVGRVSDEDKFAFYTHSDCFIMPNIPVKGDTEGFGIVCIEAGRHGLPVIASNLEGVRDAVYHEHTGYLVEPYNDYSLWMRYVYGHDFDANSIVNIVQKNYVWSSLIKKYIYILHNNTYGAVND